MPSNSNLPVPLSSSSSRESWSRKPAPLPPGRACLKATPPRPPHPTSPYVAKLYSPFFYFPLPSTTAFVACPMPPLMKPLYAAPSHVRITNPHSSALPSMTRTQWKLWNGQKQEPEMKTMAMWAVVITVSKKKWRYCSQYGRIAIYGYYSQWLKPRRICQRVPLCGIFCLSWEDKYFWYNTWKCWGLNVTQFLLFCFINLQKRSFPRISVRFKFQK